MTNIYDVNICEHDIKDIVKEDNTYGVIEGNDSENLTIYDSKFYDEFFIQRLDKVSPTLKWKLLSQSPTFREMVSNGRITLENGCLYSDGVEINNYFTMVDQFFMSIDHQQGVYEQFMAVIENIPIIKDLCAAQRTQIASQFVSLIAHIYAIYVGHMDPIMWVTQLTGIIGILLSFLHILKTVPGNNNISEIPELSVSQNSLLPEVFVSEAMEALLDVGKQNDEHSCDKGIKPVRYPSPADFYRNYPNGKILVHEGSTTSYVGNGDFIGCAVLLFEGVDFYPLDKQQSAADIIDSPLFSGVIGILYTASVALIAKTGLGSIKDILDFSRIKDSVLKSVKDTKEFTKFLAVDVFGIMADPFQRTFDSLSDRHKLNQELLERNIQSFCLNNESFYELRQAVVQSTDLLKNVKTTNETRTPLLSIISLLNSSIVALRERIIKVEEKMRTMSSRPDVVAIHIHGMGGVGKTDFVNKVLIPQVCKALDIPSQVYSINLPKNGHWPTYAGQQIAIYDEFGAAGSEDPINEHFNGLLSSGYFSMNGAELTEKPQPCAIRILFLLSNKGRWNLRKKLLPEAISAFWSRLTTYHIEWDGYTPQQRLTRTDRKEDFSHLRFSQETFRNEDNEFNPTSRNAINSGDIINHIVAQYRKFQARFMESLNDHQEVGSRPCVFNITGDRGVGKSYAIVNFVAPFLTRFTGIPVHHVRGVIDLVPHNQKRVYIIDDILTSDSSSEILQAYTNFYNAVPNGSIIILISNMKFSRRFTLSRVGFCPVPSWYCPLGGSYYSNDPIIRRIGLEGWISNKSGSYHEDFSGTEYVMQSQGFIDRKDNILSTLQLSQRMIEVYQEYLNTHRLYSIQNLPAGHVLPMEDLGNYLQFRDMTLEELANAVRKGGIHLLSALRKGNIVIPQHIFNRFNPDYPVTNFEFSTNPDALLQQIPKFMTMLRMSIPEAEVLILCGQHRLMTRGQIVLVEVPPIAPSEIFVDQRNGEHFLVMRTNGYEDRIPARDMFLWIQGNNEVFKLANYACKDFDTARAVFMAHPIYGIMNNENARRSRDMYIQKLQAKYVPKIQDILEAIPVTKILLGICVVVTSAVALKFAISFFKEKSDIQQKKAGRKNVKTNQYGSNGWSDEDPDPLNYPKNKNEVPTHLSKETAHQIDWERYQTAKDLYDSKNQSFVGTINTNIPAVDLIIDAVEKSSVRVIYKHLSLVGHMTHARFGVTTAHFFQHCRLTDGKEDIYEYLPTHVFQIEQGGKMYNAQVVKYSRDVDQAYFEIIDKQYPAQPDIRKYFVTNDRIYSQYSYEGALVKYRGSTVIEKCNINYAENSPLFWNSRTDSGVMVHGIDIQFLTSENGVATKDGDCGSFYILTGNLPTQDQHKRIIGMHVGLRRMEYPHGTTFHSNFLFGTGVGESHRNQLFSAVNELDETQYNVTGREMLSPDLLQITQTLEAVEDPFCGSTIQVLGRDPSTYVKGLDQTRQPTGFQEASIEVFGHDSGMIPTTTRTKGMDLSNVMMINGKYDILATQFKPYGEKLGIIDMARLRKVVDHLDIRYRSIYAPYKQLPTFDEAVNGYPDGHPLFGKMNRLNLDSSAGPYWLKKYKISKKRDFFILVGDKWVLKENVATKELVERTHFIIDQIRTGVAYQTLTQVCLKGELRPKEKVKKGVIRTFDSTDVATVMAHRMLLVNTTISVQDLKSRAHGGPQIGQNALADFPMYVTRFGKRKLLQADFSQYDRRLHPKVIEEAYYLALRVQDFSKENSRTMAHAMMLQTCFSYRLVGSMLCRTQQGISSGMYFTSLGDSIANEIMMYYTMLGAYSCTCPWITSNMDPIILGDDITIAVSPDVEKIPDIIPKLISEYAKMGMVITSSDKTSPLIFEPPTDLAFCSRTIRWTANGTLVCPLKETTILALFEWVTPVSKPIYTNVNGESVLWTTEHQIVTQINDALNEAGLLTASQFKRYLVLAKKCIGILRTKNAPPSALNMFDSRYHKDREIETEDRIRSRRVLNNSLHVICENDHQQVNMSEIILAEEWSNHFHIDKPRIVVHTTPPLQGEGKLSHCVVETNWNGITKTFSGSGNNKKESKLSAYRELVKYHNITPIMAKENLSKFCKSSMRDYGASKIAFYANGKFIVIMSSMQKRLVARSESSDYALANYEAQKKFYEMINDNPDVEKEIVTSDEVASILDGLQAVGLGQQGVPFEYQTNEQCVVYDGKTVTGTPFLFGDVSWNKRQGTPVPDEVDYKSSDEESLLTDDESVDMSKIPDSKQEVHDHQLYRPRALFYAEDALADELNLEYVEDITLPVYRLQRLNANTPIVYTGAELKLIPDSHQQSSTDTGAGMSMSAVSASAPPAPIGVTPATSAVPEPQAEPTSMVNLPTGIAELENMNQPPDMLAFGGVDFDIRDLAYRQVFDHVADKPINQNVPRGTILYVQPYDPNTLNSYIRSWVKLHKRYAGPICLRFHNIGNPTFMGEIVWAWLPDVRGIQEGSIMPDEEYQKYCWVNMDVRTTWTKHFSLADARRDLFYRSTDTDADDLRTPRPGFVITMYRSVVNPFDNKEAACYFNVGSYLPQTFRVADPIPFNFNVTPSGPQTNSTNSLINRTVGTVFSEYGISDAPYMFMYTDGRSYPVVGAPLDIETSTNKWAVPTQTIAQEGSWITLNGAAATFRVVSHTYTSSEAGMLGSPYALTQYYSKNLAGHDHLGMYLEGEFPQAENSGSQTSANSFRYALAAATIDGVLSRLVNSNSGIDSARVLSDSITINISSPATTQTSLSRCIEVSWNSKRGRIYFFSGYFNTTPVGVSSIQARATNRLTGSIIGSFANIFTYSLVNDETLLRWDTTSSRAYTGTFEQPTDSVTELEMRLMQFFGTLTSRTNGFVSFSLFDSSRNIVVASVRFDVEVGFTIRALSSFSQYNGRDIAELVFINIFFGDRTVLTPVTDTSTWLGRHGISSRPLALVARDPIPPIVKDFDYGVIPEDIGKKSRLESKVLKKSIAELTRKIEGLDKRTEINALKDSLDKITEKDKQQAFAAMAGAGALQGLGQGISEWQNRKWMAGENEKDRSLHWNSAMLTDSRQREMQKAGFGQETAMQTSQFSHDQRMADMRAQLERDTHSQNREVDMRMKIASAGALAPVNQTAQARQDIATQTVTRPHKGPAPSIPRTQSGGTQTGSSITGATTSSSVI